MAPSALQQLKTIFDAWQWIVLFKKVANKGEAIVIVIVDTNLARNENSYSELLGNRKQLQAIAASNELYIPEVVIDEIVARKRLSFLREQAQINRSGILKLTSFSMNEAESLTFEQVEEEIRSDRSIQFKVLPQAPVEYAFSRIYKWAINHEPPFEERSDKGFKDACIVASIDHFIEQCSNETRVIICTDDKRMAEYFKDRNNITVEDDLKNVIKLNNRPKDEEKFEITTDTSDVDTKNAANADVNNLIEALANSLSFAETHSIISKLSSSPHVTTDQQELRILSVALENQQVEWILKDDDVSDYIKPIFLRHKDDLIDSEYTRYLDAFDLPDEREEKCKSPFFTTKEKQAFRNFINEISRHTVYKSHLSTFELDADTIRTRLHNLLESHLLDSSLANVKYLTDILINGAVETKPGPISINTISDFVSLLDNASPRKREAIIANLISHLEDIEDDIPF